MALPEPRQPGRPQGGGDTGWGPTGMSQPGKQQQLLMATLPALGRGWGAGLVLSPSCFCLGGAGGQEVNENPRLRGPLGAPREPNGLRPIPILSNYSTFIRGFQKQNWHRIATETGQLSEQHRSPRVSPTQAKPSWHCARSRFKLLYLCSAMQTSTSLKLVFG